MTSIMKDRQIDRYIYTGKKKAFISVIASIRQSKGMDNLSFNDYIWFLDKFGQTEKQSFEEDRIRLL